jgi:hypothetical protein
MNYLKRQKALLKAVSKAYEGRSDEERHAEFDRLMKTIQAMIKENAGIACDTVDFLVWGKEPAWEEATDRISVYMTFINLACSKYGVEPMFPAAESHAGDKEIRNELNTFLKQVSVSDRLSREALRKAIEAKEDSGYMDEYIRLCDHLDENIEKIIEEEEKNTGI